MMRGIIIRRSLKTKILIVCLVLITCVLYLKLATNNANSTEYDSAKLLNEYNVDVNYEEMINDDLAKQINELGNNGQASILTNTYSINRGQQQMKTIALNEELSEHLSYNRTLGDARNPLCKNLHYNLNELPSGKVLPVPTRHTHISKTFTTFVLLFFNFDSFHYNYFL